MAVSGGKECLCSFHKGQCRLELSLRYTHYEYASVGLERLNENSLQNGCGGDSSA